MLTLLRKTRLRSQQILDRRDEESSARVITLGSGYEAQVQLSGAGVGAIHAVVYPQPDGSLRIRCGRGCRVEVAGKACRRALLAPGESATLGPHRISADTPPSGFDALLDIGIDTEATSPIQTRLRKQLPLRLPRIRAISYLLALIVAICGFGLPIASFHLHDTLRVAAKAAPSAVSAASTSAAVTTPRLNPELAELAVFTHFGDQMWTAGPLANAHHVPGIADNCKVCHVKAFTKVPNKACVACHDQTASHFPAGHPILNSFDANCRSCHVEHNVPSTLVKRDDSLCVACHVQTQKRQLAGAVPVTGLPVVAAPHQVGAATAFSIGAHPLFLVSVLHLIPKTSPPRWQVVREPLKDAHSASNLKFSHAEHLNFDKVSWADGLSDVDRPLVCSDCHKLDPKTGHFQPMTMEKTCRGCHSLAFDDIAPDRQLPHGDVQQLRTYLQEYYVTRAALDTAQPQRQPARPVPAAIRRPRCTGNPLTCGQQWAHGQMNKLFTKAGCVSCHTVYHDAAGHWQVRPVRLITKWYSTAVFDHRPHLNTAPGKLNDSCANCHRAKSSKLATDVLIPGIKTCVSCHASTVHAAHALHASAATSGGESVASECVDCHVFHRPGMPMMGRSLPAMHHLSTLAAAGDRSP